MTKRDQQNRIEKLPVDHLDFAVQLNVFVLGLPPAPASFFLVLQPSFPYGDGISD